MLSLKADPHYHEDQDQLIPDKSEPPIIIDLVVGSRKFVVKAWEEILCSGVLYWMTQAGCIERGSSSQAFSAGSDLSVLLFSVRRPKTTNIDARPEEADKAVVLFQLL